MQFGVGFHRTLLKMGKWRFGIGFRMKGATGIIMLCIYGMMNLMWYMILGCCWLIYGMCYLMFFLPIRAIYRACKKNSSTPKNNTPQHNNSFTLNSQSKKERLLKWQALVTGEAGDRLVMSEQQLRNASNQQAQNDLRIMNDCKKIIESTLDPETFFSRLNLLVEKGEHLCKLEEYISFSGASPSAALSEIKAEYQEAIKQFLVRYFCDTFDKAEALKTQNGKNGRYKKFYDSLQPYYSVMNADNIDYIETKYRAYTK